MKCSDFTLLFAEDDPSIRTIYLKTFIKEGYRVYPCENASQVLDKLREEKIDLLVTDLEMPGANTFELLLELKKEYPRLPVVVVTGHYQNFQQEFLDRGYHITEFMNKPIDIPVLKQKIREILKIETV